MRKDNNIDFLGNYGTTKGYFLMYHSFLLLTHHLSRKDVMSPTRDGAGLSDQRKEETSRRVYCWFCKSRAVLTFIFETGY